MKKKLGFGCGILVGLALSALIGGLLGSVFYFYDPTIARDIADKKYIDAIHLAQQLGRLDILTLMIAIFATLMGFLGLSWLTNLRNEAKLIAELVAKEVADQVAKDTAAEYFKKRDLESSNRNSASSIPMDQVNVANAVKDENNE